MMQDYLHSGSKKNKLLATNKPNDLVKEEKGYFLKKCSHCVDGFSPVWVSHLQQLSALLRQQADGLSVVLDGLLQDQVLLQQLQRARLVLAAGGRDSNREFHF